MSHNTLMKAKVKWKGVTFRKEYWLFNETLTDCFLLTWWCWRYTFFREDWGTESCGGGKQEYWDVCSSNFMCVGTTRGFPGGSDSKGSACNAGDQVQSLGQKDPLEKGMASSILTWRIPWTEEPGRLQSLRYRESNMTERLSTHNTQVQAIL